MDPLMRLQISNLVKLLYFWIDKEAQKKWIALISKRWDSFVNSNKPVSQKIEWIDDPPVFLIRWFPDKIRISRRSHLIANRVNLIQNGERLLITLLRLTTNQLFDGKLYATARRSLCAESIHGTDGLPMSFYSFCETPNVDAFLAYFSNEI